MRALVLFALATVMLAALTAGCSDRDHSATPANEGKVSSVPKAVVKPISQSALLSGATSPGGCVAGRQVALAPGTTAIVRHPVVVRTRASQSAPELARFGRVNVNGVRTVFALRTARLGASCRPTWLRVQVPIRPNGVTGWVSAASVTIYRVDTSVVIDLSDRRVEVFRRGKLVISTPAAIGRPETPTPLGRYYINQRLLTTDSSGPFGPGGAGISAFSPVLKNWPQGGPIAIHGTNAEWSIGEAASNGCVRITNSELLRLIHIVEEGTPVTIRA
jgi:lipoprotein-anchoring transpeptidase ErfK/SrfK